MSKPNYRTAKFFTEDLLVKEIPKKTQILMNKSVFLGLSILQQKILMYEFWYDYVKQKYGETAKLCCMDTDSFIVCMKTDDLYKDIAEDVETRSDTLSYE